MSFVNVSTPLKNLLIKILGEPNKDYVALSLNWSEIVGEYLAENSYVFNIEKNVVFVGVSNSVIMQEFCLLRDCLKKKITRIMKIKVNDIVFFIKDDAKKSKNRSVYISSRSK